jgi:hypothetical protein
MAWTKTTRAHHQREALRYASDLTDAEWRLIESFLPRASKIGRPRKTNLRPVVEASQVSPTSSSTYRAELCRPSLEAVTMRSFKGGCLVARLTVELMTCKLATSCELSGGKITRV